MKNGLEQLLADLEHARSEIKKLTYDAPRIMGVQAVNFFRLNFEKEGMIRGGSVSKWKGRIAGTPRNDRKILSDRGNLEDSIRYEITGKYEVNVGVDLNKIPYAKLMNEGGKIIVTPLMRKYFWAQFYNTGDVFWRNLALTKKTEFDVPARQYMDITPDLEKNIERKFDKRIKRIFKR